MSPAERGSIGMCVSFSLFGWGEADAPKCWHRRNTVLHLQNDLGQFLSFQGVVQCKVSTRHSHI